MPSKLPARGWGGGGYQEAAEGRGEEERREEAGAAARAREEGPRLRARGRSASGRGRSRPGDGAWGGGAPWATPGPLGRGRWGDTDPRFRAAPALTPPLLVARGGRCRTTPANRAGYLKRGESLRHSSKSTVIFILPPPRLASRAALEEAEGPRERPHWGSDGFGGRTAATSAARDCGGRLGRWS